MPDPRQSGQITLISGGLHLIPHGTLPRPAISSTQWNSNSLAEGKADSRNLRRAVTGLSPQAPWKGRSSIQAHHSPTSSVCFEQTIRGVDADMAASLEWGITSSLISGGGRSLDGEKSKGQQKTSPYGFA